MSAVVQLDRGTVVSRSSSIVEVQLPMVEFRWLCIGSRDWLLITPAWRAALGLSIGAFQGRSYITLDGTMLALEGQTDARVFMRRFEAEFGRNYICSNIAGQPEDMHDWVTLHCAPLAA
jgi:hypothetical protein